MALAVEERMLLAQAACQAARRDPASWCQLASRGRWEPVDHAVLMLAKAREVAERGGRLIVSTSVRHSKTWTVVHGFGSWWLGNHPDDRIIHGTAESDLAQGNSQAIRDRLNEFGPSVFGVSVDQDTGAKRRWDILGHDGGVTAVGRGGAPEGRGGHILIDDPYRSFKDAMSPIVRKEVRDWWTNSLRPRMEPGAWAIVMCARWHVEDLSGWLLKEFGEQWEELRMPAICDDVADPMGRQIGEALWPARWPLDELAKARAETLMEEGEIGWYARYQQRPLDTSSTMFPVGQWVEINEADAKELQVVQWVRGWDLAATEGAGDWTVGVLMGRLDDGRFLIRDVVRGQLGADGVRSLLKDTATSDLADYPGVEWVIPQDPGQAGKGQSQQLIRHLAPMNVTSKPITGAKEVRAAGWSAQQRAGNVLIVGSTNATRLIATHSTFPGGAHDDDTDAAADAFNHLAGGPAPGAWFSTSDAFHGATIDV